MTSYTHPSNRGLEKEGSTSDDHGQYLSGHEEKDPTLHELRAAKSLNISPELFEKMYLSPENRVKGDLRKTFGNPTPLGLLGYLLALSPLACDMMGWRGAGGDNSQIGSYYFIGGLLMLMSGSLEFFLGNTFPFIVFCSYGGFFLSLGATLTPFFYAYGSYVTDPNNQIQGLQSKMFESSFGFFMLFMAILSLIYLVCAIRTNIIFVIIFMGLFFDFAFLTGAYWQNALGEHDTANKLQVTAGAWAFIACIAGWWIFISQMLAALDFPFQIPVGDLSTLVKGASQKVAEKEGYEV